MLKRLTLVVMLLSFLQHAFAQITSDPAIAVATQKVTITFDSSKENRLGYFTGDLYAHTGVIIEGSSEWQHVIGLWGNNTQQPKLTNKGNGIYELEITPDINTYYSVSENEKVVQLAFVFRSADAGQQTNDLKVDVFEEGLVINITEPSGRTIFEKNDPVDITAISSVEADLKIFFGNDTIVKTTGTQIIANHSFTQSGQYLMFAEATLGNESVRDSISIFVRENTIEQSKPIEIVKGINYPTDTSAALVLWAPLKEFVFVIGDFNDWKLSNDFQMKKDGDYFWIEIPGLEKRKEYIFQYYIDGEIKIADPYSEKIVDPWNDKNIDDSTFPDLIPYPENKTEGIASVLQPGQEEYQWEVTDFQKPENDKLVIYELLIRDFTQEHSFKAVRERLDYLEDLNINVLELMPVNEFEGNSSWGYNPSFYFAPDKYYGPKNELKKLIDECHKRGIAVVLDMVLNHSYGQSPFVQMYMDNWTVTPDNPWYNISSPNPVFNWGYDLNHESEAVEELVDSVNSFWINEYKIDGFRFDFTKGFTNTPGDGSTYDASRISILKRMADEIWKRKPGTLVILEHFAPNSEETILANYGMMIWGNMNHNYAEGAMGYNESSKSNLEWGVYDERNWDQPNLVTYMESHDEERLVYKCIQFGKTTGNYSTKELNIALDRIELNALFHVPLPGPKMIWQFGELGYDYSIEYNERVGEKPIRWDYLEDMNRTDLFQVMAKLNYLKQTYEEFSPASFSYDLKNELKWYTLSKNNNHVLAIGNFDTIEKEVNVTFPETGKWYDFFNQDSIEIGNQQQTLSLSPGEYRLYSTRNFESPRIVTDINETIPENRDIMIFPNPAESELNVSSNNALTEIRIYSITGKLMLQQIPDSRYRSTIIVDSLTPGIYVVHVEHNNQITKKKIIKF